MPRSACGTSIASALWKIFKLTCTCQETWSEKLSSICAVNFTQTDVTAICAQLSTRITPAARVYMTRAANCLPDLAGVSKPVDIASANSKYFVNMATGGFGTEAAKQTDSGLKDKVGGAAYVITGEAIKVLLLPLSEQSPIIFHLQPACCSMKVSCMYIAALITVILLRSCLLCSTDLVQPLQPAHVKVLEWSP